MAVQHLDVAYIEQAYGTLDTSVKQFNDTVTAIASDTRTLFDYWHGEGKTEFENYYNEVYKKLEDVNDVMYELYDALVDAAANYTEVDIEMAKQLSIAEGN